MAIIYATSSSFGSASWSDPSVWVGGVVPTSSDEVRIYGLRGRMNQTSTGVNGLDYWEGNKDIYFDILSSLPAADETGSLYLYTNRNYEVKIDYESFDSSSATAGFFRNCSVDTSYQVWEASGSEDAPSNKGGYIIRYTYGITRPGIIYITGSGEYEMYRTEVRYGGALHISDSPTIKVENYIKLWEGDFIASGSIKFLWNQKYTGTAQSSNSNESAHSFIGQESAHYSRFIFEGPEVRTYTTLTDTASVDDAYLQVESASNFEVGDWIFVGEENANYVKNQSDPFDLNYHSTQEITSEDEAFYVVGKDTGSNHVYVQRMNGLETKVLATASATELIVDSQQWAVGDKVVINNQVRTIQAVSDYSHSLADYDFVNNTASILADWDFESLVYQQHNDWNFNYNNGLTTFTPQGNANNRHRHTSIKNLVRSTVKVECTVYNSLNITGSDTANGYFGVTINGNPAGERSNSTIYGSDNNVRSVQRTYFGVYPQLGYTFFNPLHKVGWSISHSLDLAGVAAPYVGEYRLALEFTKGFTKAYINDTQVFEAPDIAGSGFEGKVGIFSSNHKAVFRDFKAYALCQKITLDSSVTVDVDDVVYETGVEHEHIPTDKVIKLASLITDPMDHENLAYAYIGSPDNKGTNIYPSIKDTRYSTTVYNNDRDYPFFLTNETQNYYTFISRAEQWVTIDLQTPTTFSNVGFIENRRTIGQTFNRTNGVEISGSNDYETWTPLTGGLDLRPRITRDSIRSYDVGEQVFRYVRIRFDGISTSTYNEIKSLYVRNFASGSSTPRIRVNNVSDFEVGDNIFILPKDIYVNVNNETLGNDIYTYLLAGSSSADLLDGYPDYHTIAAISESVITLDRPFNKYPLTKDSRIVKLNKDLSITGSYGSGSMYPGKLYSYSGDGFIYLRETSFKNVEFQNQSDEFPYRGDRFRGAMQFAMRSHDAKLYMQGCSLYNHFTDGYFLGSYSALYRNSMFLRHNTFTHIYRGSQYLFPRETNYGYLPSVFTGNVFSDLYPNYRAGNFYSYMNDSYNIHVGSVRGLDNVYTTVGARELGNGSGLKFKHERNLYWSVSEGARRASPTSDENQDMGLFIIKNNKIQYSNYTYVGTYTHGTPIDTLLLPNTLRPSSRNSNPPSYWNQGALNRGSNAEYGVPTSYITNYNRFGYDLYAHKKGWIVKHPDEEFYKYYSFTTTTPNAYDVRYPLIATNISIADNATASFDLSFTYYNSPDTISQLTMPWSQSAAEVDDYSALRRDGNDAGALTLFVKKDGGQYIPYEILPKSATPRQFSKTISLEGKGNYYIYVTQATVLGHTGFKDLDSRLRHSKDANVKIHSNGFTMKMFGSYDDKTYIGSIRQFVDRIKKFRLKGAKLF